MKVYKVNKNNCVGHCKYENGIIVIEAYKWGIEEDYLYIGPATLEYPYGKNPQVYDILVLRPGERQVLVKLPNDFIYIEFEASNVKKIYLDYNIYEGIYNLAVTTGVSKLKRNEMECKFEEFNKILRCYRGGNTFFYLTNRYIEFEGGNNIPVYTANGTMYLDMPDRLLLYKGECRYIGLTDRLLCFGDINDNNT